MRKTLALFSVVLLVPVVLYAQTSERLKLVDRYAKELKSRNADTRVEAAESLGNLKMAEGVPLLVTALSDGDARVREAAASALWRASDVAKEAIPALRKALADPTPAVAIRAAGALMAMDEDATTMEAPLRGVLQRGDAHDRFLAARALIGIATADELVGPIVDHLVRNSPDPKNSDWSGRRDNFEAGAKALKRLAETNDRKAVATLASRVRENAHVTKPILESLALYKPRPDQWIETLLGFLNSPSPDVRETAVSLLGKQTKASDVKLWAGPVSRLVTDKEKDVRNDAIRALQNAKGLAIDSISPVIAAVKSDVDAEIRADAAEAVGDIADMAFAIDTKIKETAGREALPVLMAAVEKDANMDVRKKALRSIDKLQVDPATAVDFFARVAVEQKDRVLRLDALGLINNRGKEAAGAQAKIEPLMKDGDELIRRVTEGALQAMKSERYASRKVTTTAAVDPGARDKALEMLREHQYAFTEEAFFTALNEVEREIVQAFLDAGMSPNHKFSNMYGNTTMGVVMESDEGCNQAVRPTPEETKATMKLLLARGANANLTDDRGMAPLMVAAQRCDAEVIKILLAAKANLNATNAAGLSAFEFGLVYGADGAAALAAAGYRLNAEKVKIYTEAYAKDAKRLALVKKATKSAK
jgi:HEAT repeat protein